MKMCGKAFWRRGGCILLCAAVLLGYFGKTGAVTVRAAGEATLPLLQAQQSAVAASSDITKKSNAITLKKMKYIEAVDGIKAKVKNITSFRWTPLLSFKFPSSLAMAEEFDLNVKPLLLQTEITTLRHSLDELRRDALYKVNRAYLNAYVLQEKNRFTGEKLALAQTELARNRARLMLGDASQTDVDTMQKSVEKLTAEAAAQGRSFLNAKSELSGLIKLDVTTAYRFADAMFTASIPREQLAPFTDYTLANSQSYYEVKTTASTALMTLNSYEGLMRGHYGADMHYIQPYINGAKQGRDVDYAAFQISYDQMLKKLDEPWNGVRRILFFKFPKEWFKGEMDGTRYIEDELYALYTACMEYAAAKKDMEDAEKNLRKEVAAAYEGVVTAGNSYQTILRARDETKKSYDLLLALNRLGKANYSEVNDKKTDYQDAQAEALDSLAAYNELLYSFDKLTCGAASRYFSGEGLTSGAGGIGESFAEDGAIDALFYHIYTSVADMVFIFGLEVPDGYAPELAGYELWYEGVQLGARTPAGAEMRHLALDYGETSSLTVKVFGDDGYIGECEIDTSVPRDKLSLRRLKLPPEESEEQIGTYAVTASAVGGVGLSKLTLSVKPSVGASFYTLAHKNGAALTGGLVPAGEGFEHMSLLSASLEDITVTLYGADKRELRKAALHTKDQTLWSAKK